MVEEWFEVLVGQTLGYHDKPIVLLNINGYYGPLLTLIVNKPFCGNIYE